MSENPVVAGFATARTAAVQRALAVAHDHTMHADFLFLERWEQVPIPGAAAALRINQIRRANPALAAEIRAELRHGRPLTSLERAALELPRPAGQPPTGDPPLGASAGRATDRGSRRHQIG